MIALKATAVLLLLAALSAEPIKRDITIIAVQPLHQLIYVNEDPNVCKDRSASCAFRAEMGICYRADSWEAIFEECPKSCNQCKCGDNHNLCPVWALENQCYENPGWMHSQCRYSCNVCGDQLQEVQGSYSFKPDIRPLVIALQPRRKPECEDKDYNCPAWANEGQCYKADWDYMFNKCPKSCSRCVCGDNHHECAKFAEAGHCTYSNGWMQVHCQQSCGLC